MYAKVINYTLSALLVLGALAAIFTAGYIISDETCDPIDANCDGKVNLQDLSIHMWRAEMVTEIYGD